VATRKAAAASKITTAKTTTAKTTTAKTTAAAKTAKAQPAATASAKTSQPVKAAKVTKETPPVAPPQDQPPPPDAEPHAEPHLEPHVETTATSPVEQDRKAPPTGLWDQLRAEPRRTPELLARAAVEWFGPEADRYTRWVRSTYPTASDDRIAQAAARRFTAQARRGVLARVVAREAGEAATLTLLQVRMVLHIAAAYRHDPTAPERAAELLNLLRAPRAGTAATAVGQRLATRLVPGAGLLLGALVHDAATEALARRAIGLYRPVPRLP
jgi:hypothetical protein